MSNPRHLKIFISSTFEDMQEEREVLLKETFLEFKKLAKERFVEITEIDLRTGISPEQAENGEIVKVCLDEIKRCSDSPIFFLGILGHRYGSTDWIADIGDDVLEDDSYAWIKDYSDRSITELEIISAIKKDEQHKRAFFYLKEGEDDNPKLTNLKNALHSKHDNNLMVAYYKDISNFRKQTIDSLTKALDELFPKDEKISEVEKLRATHNIFAKSRQKVYISHSKNESILDDFMNNEEDRLLLYGESGYGKSALIANYFEIFKKESDSFVIEHYIGGAGELSNDLHQMLRRVMLEIKEEFDVADKVPSEPQKIMNEFALWLHRVKRPTVIVFDGYNQIEDEMKEKLFYYIPDKLKNVKLIITSIKDNYPIDNRYKIEPLTKEDQKELVVDYLKLYGKEGIALKIQNQVTKHPQTDNTLFLRTLLDEIRLLGNFDNVEKDIANYLQAKDTVALFIKIFERLENDYRENLAKEVLSLLYVSRDGLSEDNLMEIINHNTTKKLTRLEFSPLFLAVEEHLIDRGGLYGFFHGYILESVEKRYLSSEELINGERRKIADYFEGREIDKKKVKELPFHLYNLKDKDNLYKVLVEVDFFFRLVDDEKLEYEALKYLQFIDETYNISKDMLPILLRSNSVYKISRIALFLSDTYIKYDEALLLYKKSLQLQIELFGENHEKTSQSYINLSDFYKLINDFNKALFLCKKATKIRENILGSYHLSTIEAYNNLADIYRLTQDYTNALEILEKNTNISTKYLGNKHKETLHTYNILALVYSSLHMYDKAMELYKKNFKIAKSIYAKYEHSIGRDYNNLSAGYYYLGDYNNALLLLKKALDFFKSFYGEMHPETSQVYQNLGKLYLDIGNLEKAIIYFDISIKIQEKLFNSFHSSLILSYTGLGDIYVLKNKNELAFPLFKKALNISIKLYGEKGDSTARCYNSLGIYYDSINNYKESIKCYQKAIEGYLSVFESNHPELQTVYSNLVSLYFESTAEYDKAIIYIKKILEIKEQLSEIDIELVGMYNTLGVCYFKLKDYKQAYKYYKKTLKLAKEDEEQYYIYVSSSYNNLAKLSVTEKDYKRAFLLYEKSIAMEEKSSYPNPRIYINYGDYFYQINDLENAKKYYLKAIEILESNVIYKDHPDLIEAKNSLEKVNQKLNV